MAVLADKVAVITGGTSGIVANTVETFVREGARVVFTGRQEAKGTDLVKRLGDAALFLAGDVSIEGHVKEAVDLAVTSFGRPDCMFNNAGAPGAAGPIAAIPADDFDATVAVLFRGVFLGMKHAAPLMIEQGPGTIITNASVAGLRTGYGPHIYSATKAAVIHLTRSVAMELGEHGVRVNCICLVQSQRQSSAARAASPIRRQIKLWIVSISDSPRCSRSRVPANPKISPTPRYG